MNYNDKIAAGLRDLEHARQFQEFFPDAEHVVVQAKHDLDPDGWTLVDEWISRANLYDRYALWLVVPIEFTASGDVSPLDQPAIYIVEVEKVEKGRDEKGGPKWECNFGQFEEKDWKELIEAGGDFEAVGAGLITDAPVEGFATFWRDTAPPPVAPAPDGLALHAPLRFMS
jgi:hypothetical protein